MTTTTQLRKVFELKCGQKFLKSFAVLSQDSSSCGHSIMNYFSIHMCTHTMEILGDDKFNIAIRI